MGAKSTMGGAGRAALRRDGGGWGVTAACSMGCMPAVAHAIMLRHAWGWFGTAFTVCTATHSSALFADGMVRCHFTCIAHQ